MKPDERENQRYLKEDFCLISKEEEIMFSLLSKHIKNIKKQPTEIAILDVGCGSGRIGEKLKRVGYDVVGLDFSEEAVKKATSIGIKAIKTNLDEGIPMNSQSIDVVWAGDIIEHVFDPIGLLNEISRVLRPGSIALITIPNDVGLISRIKILFGISHQEQMYYKSGFYKHHTFFTPRLIKYMLKKSNLHIEIFKKILILGNSSFLISFLPAAFYNEMIIQIKKQ